MWLSWGLGDAVIGYKHQNAKHKINVGTSVHLVEEDLCYNLHVIGLVVRANEGLV